MKKHVLSACVLSLVMAVTGCPMLSPTLMVGDPAPALDVAAWVQGDPVVIAEGLGEKAFLIEFFSTTCPSCMSAVPHIQALYEQYAGQGLVIAAISRQSAEDLAGYLEVADPKPTYAIATDNAGATHEAFMHAAGRFSIPCVFLVDKEGDITWIGSGYDLGLDDAVEALFTATP